MSVLQVFSSNQRFIAFIALVFGLALSLLSILKFAMVAVPWFPKVDWAIVEVIEIGLGVCAIVTIATGSIAVTVVGREFVAMRTRLKNTQTEFGNLVDGLFSEWGLTQTECEIALLTIKGFSIAEIAAIRGRSEGTIKSQSNAIYAKAGVSGRQQLVSAALDLLIGQ